jgi:hypothetical protein
MGESVPSLSSVGAPGIKRKRRNLPCRMEYQTRQRSGARISLRQLLHCQLGLVMHNDEMGLWKRMPLFIGKMAAGLLLTDFVVKNPKVDAASLGEFGSVREANAGEIAWLAV